MERVSSSGIDNDERRFDAKQKSIKNSGKLDLRVGVGRKAAGIKEEEEEET